MYRTANDYYKQKFGCKVYKLSVDGGFTCPNRDGTKGTGGCIFCSASGSGEFAEKGDDILSQLERAKQRVASKNKGGKYIAYFQNYTNTYAPLERLRELFYKAIEPDYIVGLSVATRPDCLPDDTIKLLKELNNIKPVSIELGLQTTNEKTAEYIRRGYKTDIYYDAVKRLKDACLDVVTHIIIGLPFESEADAIKTTKDVAAAGSNGVKFHLLHVLKNTDLVNEYSQGKFECLSLEDYAKILKKCIDVLPPETVVHRITGDGAKKDLIAPSWSADKKKTLNFLKEYLK